MQLELKGDSRIMDAYRQTRSGGRGRFRGRRTSSRPETQLKEKIRKDLLRRWPELANVMNPLAIEMLTTRKEEFIKAVQEHPDYKKYRVQADAEVSTEDKRRVKCERFLRVVDNVIFAENLRRADRSELVEQYDAIIAAERESLFAK